MNVNGTLYGTTNHGGGGTCYVVGCGAVFEIDRSGTEHVLYSFQGGSDGMWPVGGLVQVRGDLYGTTQFGGPLNYGGTVFKLSTSGEEQVLYTFKGQRDGEYPYASLLYRNGTLYGTTLAGGGSTACSAFSPNPGCGTVFKVSLTGKERVLHAFTNSPDGASPLARLTEVNGELYGTTSEGGISGQCCGTIFEISPSGSEQVLYAFKGGQDANFPEAQLLFVNGSLYGTSALGGTKAGGTVFKFDTSGGEAIIHSFGAHRPYDPSSSLIYKGGFLFGTTQYGGGGKPGHGLVFKMSLLGGTTVLHRFQGPTDGESPVGGLIFVGNALLGTTPYGGAGSFGTVYSVTP